MTTDRTSAALRSLRSSDVRDLLHHAHRPGMLSLAGGLPSPQHLPAAAIEQATILALRQHPIESLQYGPTEGSPRLRHQILTDYAAEQNALCANDDKLLASESPLQPTQPKPPQQFDCLITSGSQQALDLMARCLIEPGDSVLLQAPTYLAALQCFQLQQAQLKSLDFNSLGDDVGAIHDQLSAGIKLIYLIPNFANPSGVTMTRAQRHAWVQAVSHWNRQHPDATIHVFEDDPYGALRFRGPDLPSLHALAGQIAPDQQQHFSYAGSLSKILAPGLRLGYWIGDPHLLRQLSRCKQCVDLHSSSLAQAIVSELFDAGFLSTSPDAPHLPKLKQHYAMHQACLAAALQDEFGDRIQFERPDGGMFLWCQLPAAIDTRARLAPAIANGVLFVPGDAFYTHDAPKNYVRLCYSTLNAEALNEAARRLAQTFMG